MSLPFPVNVPNVPGVPSVLFAPDVGELLTLLEGDALSFFASALQLPWGIYLGVIPVVLADTVTSFNFSQEFTISDFPIENGDFASYNKVYRPFTGTFRFAAGGDSENRQRLFDSIGAIIGDTNSYNLVTSDQVYTGVNLTGQQYARTPTQGLGLLQIDVTVEQVKQVFTLTLTDVISSPLDPSQTSQVNDGTVQAMDPSSSQLAALPNFFGGG